VTPRTPGFFVVGAQKAGTTSLYEYLRQHPQIYMSPVKEPSYFAPEQCPGGPAFTWESYLRLFAGASVELALGEATATYLWSAAAPLSIAARIPDARIVIILRSPIDRAFSQYLHMLTEGATRRSFRAQIDESLRHPEMRFSHTWPFLELGLYHQQVTRYLRQFRRSNIHICYYEEFARSPLRVMSDLYAFLGVDRAYEPDVTRRHNEPRVPKAAAAMYVLKRSGVWRVLRTITPPRMRSALRSAAVRSRDSLTIDPADHDFLASYYRHDVEQLSSLLDRDLTPWLTRFRR
jgi:hypothetical protein